MTYRSLSSFLLLNLPIPLAAMLLGLLATSLPAKAVGLSLGEETASPCTPGQGVGSFSESAPPNSLLVGVRIRSGQWIDAVTPLFAAIQPDGRLGAAFPGHEEGGRGGTAQPDFVHDGYVVAGINRRAGVVLDAVQIIWRPWTGSGMKSGPVLLSPWIGGSGGTEIPSWTAPEGYAGTALNGYVGDYTNGSRYINMLCLTAQKATLSLDNMQSSMGTPLLVSGTGLFLLLLILGVVLFAVRVTAQLFFVIRVLIALAGGAFAAIIPGFLNVTTDAHGIAIRAGGALAVFVILYFFTPQIISDHPPP